ncbi:uncharacterized protein METZ01_LOCUS152564 [marine metagenome]|uniref:Uncharacterized protein n=1 Tax=marine metagenome TaxID=408172 RepID=A0A382ADR8_9ZZZZ
MGIQFYSLIFIPQTVVEVIKSLYRIPVFLYMGLGPRHRVERIDLTAEPPDQPQIKRNVLTHTDTVADGLLVDQIDRRYPSAILCAYLFQIWNGVYFKAGEGVLAQKPGIAGDRQPLE